MKKKLLLVIITIGLLTGCGKIPKLANGEEALIELGDGTKYSANEVWEEVKESYALDVVLKKIDLKILESEYKDKENDVKEYLSSIETSLKTNFVDENKKFDEKALQDALTEAGFNSLDEYLERQKVGYLTELATTDYAKKQITDKEIKNYYKNTTEGDISCVHILVKPNRTSSDDDKKALEEANKIISAIKKDIKSGTKAEDAFKKYENDEKVTYQDLGYFNKGDMESTFETAAYALKKGAYTSTPVKTTYGYHVILKVDQKEKPELKDVEDKIRETLANELIEKDSKTSVNAMVELRKSNGVKWYDSELENAYNKYINYLINKSDSSN